MPSWSDVPMPPPAPEVLAEVFGEEAVVVQLRTGAYYAFDEAATTWWSRLWEGDTLGSAAATDDEHALLVGLLRYLVQEELLQLATSVTELAPAEGDPRTYAGIEKFTDMEDLLVLDPIHDIDLDGSGWPTVVDVVRD
jgi:hypothetical protein